MKGKCAGAREGKDVGKGEDDMIERAERERVKMIVTSTEDAA